MGRKRSLSPETKPKQEPLDDDERLANGSAEGMDVDAPGTETDEDLAKETHSMPPPTPLTFEKYPVRKAERTADLDLILNVSFHC